MAGNGPCEQAVFFAGAAADIVDQQRPFAPRLAVRNNPAMGQLAANDAGDNIAGQIGLGLLRERLLRTAAFEEGPHIRHAAMVDIAIRRLEPPDFGIGGKGLFHIAMDKRLQIEPQTIAIGTDNNIGAGPRFARKITVGIADAVIGLTVNCGHSNLTARGFDKARRPAVALREQRGGDKQANARSGQKSAPGGLHGRNVAEGR